MLEVRDSKYGKFNEVEKRLKKMDERAMEFAPSRSTFQIEKFIGMDQYTDVAKYRHLAHNSHVMLENLRDMLIDRERSFRKLERLKLKLSDQPLSVGYDPHYKDLDLDIYQLNCSIDNMDVSIKGTLIELDTFEALCDALEDKNGKPFTWEDFELAQPQEWHDRFASQMHKSQAGNKLGVGEGNYGSYLQALEEPILKNSINKIEPIPTEFNSLAVTALGSREGIAEKLLQPIPIEEQQKIEE